MFHREGFKIILITFSLVVLVTIMANIYIVDELVQKAIQVIVLIFWMFILQFFRNPKRKIEKGDNHVTSPVDGKVVVVKKIFEKEYFKDYRIQVSLFMSPLNVHVTRYPVRGKVLFSKYHPGKYLVAWHPKSSELNERTTVVVESRTYGKVLYRQIAGGLARRIVNYAKVGENVGQGDDSGFIKFGSRVDLFLPLNSNIRVHINQKIKGGQLVSSL